MKKLTLDTKHKQLLGVCGGLGNYAGIDANIFRIAFVIGVVGYGFGIGLYLILWLFIPKE